MVRGFNCAVGVVVVLGSRRESSGWILGIGVWFGLVWFGLD